MTSAIPPATTHCLRGIDLRLMRTARRLTVTAVAQAGGWTRTRVSNIEATDRPTIAAVARYYRALEAAEAERNAR